MLLVHICLEISKVYGNGLLMLSSLVMCTVYTNTFPFGQLKLRLGFNGHYTLSAKFPSILEFAINMQRTKPHMTSPVERATVDLQMLARLRLRYFAHSSHFHRFLF